MRIELTINGRRHRLEAAPSDTLLAVLRREGFHGVKHGCDTGECGACTVIVNGRAVTSCNFLAVQAAGAVVETIEGLQQSGVLHPLQERFAQTAATQCGFCTPGMIMAAKALLDENPAPTDAEVRRALSSTICRCTGYKQPVDAVLQAAADLRGEPFVPEETPAATPAGPEAPGAGPVLTKTQLKVVGKSVRKVDNNKLVTGRPAFTDDIELRGLLHARLLMSPHAHARIRRIDATKARLLPGVHAVLTHEDLPRVTYTTAGQSYPEPSPLDTRSLDNKVRFVGDRVAAVAAETPEIAEEALRLIEVEYDVLPAVFDPAEALRPGAPIIHDEPDCSGIGGYDASRNIAAEIHAQVGNVEKGFEHADIVIERTYKVPQVQQTPIETHICIARLDENNRLELRTSTQVPFHVRRIIAPVLGLRPSQIRVIKPRIGGGFGVKQEIIVEDIAGHLTLRTGRPVKLELSREEEFMATRSRHPQVLRMRTGVTEDGTMVAHEMVVLANTGAYGSHALTVQSNTGSKAMALYRCPNMKFECRVAYTNLPPAGAFRGYGGPQGFFAVESHLDEVANALRMDPLEFRLKNCLRAGDVNPLAEALGEGREGFEQRIVSCGLPASAEFGRQSIGWDDFRMPSGLQKRRGVGVAFAMHGTAIPGLDMGAASLKMNDDGTFNLLVGATDLGTGSDTVLAQLAAEVLGVQAEEIIVYSSDTDMTPFDTGAYASSTTYISGGAVVRVAEDVAAQIQVVAGAMLDVSPDDLELRDGKVFATDGRSVTLEEVALRSLHQANQHQIGAIASKMSYDCPPPFAVTFADTEVDVETGEVQVKKLVMSVDAGRIVNPILALGQIEGGMAQALGYAVAEEMVYDEAGRMVNPNFRDYRVFLADEMPAIVAHLVETEDPFGPYGVKAVAEIPMDGVAPAVANAIFAATGVRMTEIPLTPERVWKALQESRRAKKE
ncbi:MAG TPA: molybdopterin cofactor-binding domain-containing protein [Symbiobacteriaceae bacterium]|nr:molybdopterin cofactor-binding domain-containing protein [Symbiobacteriaceae bacterium]